MTFETLAETLIATADDLRDIKTVIAIPAMDVPAAVRIAVDNLVMSALDQARLVLLKSAVRLQQAEEADRANLEMED